MSIALEPGYLVLLAFGADASEVAPQFTDVSADLLSITVDRGSPGDLDRNNPATATFVLDNFSGAYDNENADSPYVGDLVPMTQVLIYAEYDGELYPRFRGFLDTGGQLDYPSPGEATATFTATDGFKPLAQTALPSSAYVAEVLADSPVALWRLNEPDGSPVVFDTTATYDLAASGSPEFGATGLVSREAGSSVTLDGFVGLITEGPLILTASPLSIELVYRHAGTSGGYLAGFHTTDITTAAAYLGTTVGGDVFEVTFSPTGATTTSINVGDIDDGEVHHLAMVWAANNTVILYVDGVVRNTPPAHTTGAFADVTAQTFIGGGPIGFGTDAAAGEYQMVAFYDHELSAARIAAHAAAVSTPWNNDTPGARADRVCDVVGWPEGLRNFDAGASTLQSADLDMPALEHLQKTAESEFGETFCALDGTLTLRDRGARINRPALAVFGDASGEVGYRSITFDSSDTLLRNPVTISRAEGVAQTVSDATNVARYYPHQYTLDGLYHDDDELSLYAAQFLVAEYKDPKRRIVGLSFGPAEVERIDDWYPLLLMAELGGVYDVIFRAPGVTLPFEQRSVLEGTSESWSPLAGHSVSWSLSPAYTGFFLELDAGPDNPGLDFVRLYF